MKGIEEAENSTEALEMCPKSDSLVDLAKQDEIVASFCSKKGSLDRERVADHGHHYRSTTGLGYYPRYDGTSCKLEDRSFVSSYEGPDVPCSAPYMGSRAQPVTVANRYHGVTKISSHSMQGQDVSYIPSLVRCRSTTQTINNNDRPKMNVNYNYNKNYKESSELLRGPRANMMKSRSSSSSDKICPNLLIRREQYNKSDFLVKYEQAKFFMIKSYSEDDIHKSIKYNVWASTAYGNSKLDAAFKDAEMVMKDKGTKCPIFLFFSVNASGQFVGLAEMTGPVDFKKTMDFWQQDKWNGFFPVTWHIIKDIPNRHFQSITLENNENKAVTFSRDTQEIGLPQGLRMLFIFKGFPLGTSMLDDFEFYENSEKSLRTTRSRPAPRHSGIEFNNESSSLVNGTTQQFEMNQLEAAFGKVGVSSRPRNPSDRKSLVFDNSSNLSLSYHRRHTLN